MKEEITWHLVEDEVLPDGTVDRLMLIFDTFGDVYITNLCVIRLEPDLLAWAEMPKGPEVTDV